MRLDAYGETTEDIMAEFKKAKFVIAPDYLGFGPTMVILSYLFLGAQIRCSWRLVPSTSV